MNRDDYIATRQARINQKLQNFLPIVASGSSSLLRAMHYAVLGGGKRLRPLLVYAAGESFGAPLEKLDALACAVEFIHAYSLVHDDLPSMDNDDYRRGQLTCHKAFDEVTAILAGDALQALAFQIIAEETFISSDQKIKSILCLAKAAGCLGMAEGQALEFSLKHSVMTTENKNKIDRLKTGALIEASIELGALIAGVNEETLLLLRKFAADMGVAYQLQDDIHDQQVEDVAGAKQALRVLCETALASIAEIEHTQPLRLVAQYMIPL